VNPYRQPGVPAAEGESHERTATEEILYRASFVERGPDRCRHIYVESELWMEVALNWVFVAGVTAADDSGLSTVFSFSDVVVHLAG
jgi:hypothetical protein